MTNQELYGDLPKISDKIRYPRARFAGHCFRRSDEAFTNILHWIPRQGFRKFEGSAFPYLKLLKRDAGLEIEELKTAMQDRKYLRAITVRDLKITRPISISN